MSKDVGMKHQNFARKKQLKVAGVMAPGPRPTLMAAVLVATAISVVFLTTVGVVELVL